MDKELPKYKVVSPRLLSGDKKGDIKKINSSQPIYYDGFGGVYKKVGV